MKIETGQQAPDFSQYDSDKQKITLSEYRGQPVLILFFPLAFTNTCTKELCSVRDDLASFQNGNVQILAVSVDHPFTLKAWSDAQGYEFPLLADFWPHGKVEQAYGVFNDGAGFALRGTFLVDPSGIVQFAEVNGPGEARDQNGWRKAVAALAA